MSFNGFKDTIEEGDTVILFVSVHQKHAIKATSKIINKKGQSIDNVFQTCYGAVRCEDLIGKPFGSKLTLSKGFVHILQPTPELWTLSLPHRTQIIYTPDISMIIAQLELKPGSIVIESGTGSGSLSHALIRSVMPHGHLHTFDFHAERVKTAGQEFKEHGLEKYVTVAHVDVCAHGFGNEMDGIADAVFLDLPHPWLAIPHAVKTIRSDIGGRICSFSPCIEQVQKSCATFDELGLLEIETMEVLQTKYNVHRRDLHILNLDYLKTAKSECLSQETPLKKSVKILTAVPPSSQAGHTGYLTFGTLPPRKQCVAL